MTWLKRFLLLTGWCLSAVTLWAQPLETCRATLKDDTLTLENQFIRRQYWWNGGNLVSRSLTDKQRGKTWKISGTKPDLSLPGQSEKAQQGTFSARLIPQTSVAHAHLEAEVTYTLDKLQIKRVFRLYPTSATLACDLYYRGESAATWLQPGTNLADLVNLEKLTASTAGNNTPVIEKVELPGRHWHLEAVEFFDVTDRFNNLVQKVDAITYRPALYRGNLLFATDPLTNHGIFFLKEAPASHVQLAYPGGDFLVEYGNFRVIGAGIMPQDLHPTEWRQGYGFVTGVFAGEHQNGYRALREYQARLRVMKPKRDEMILMNTWGDRGQDRRVNETFSLQELETGAKLGITHLQLDDGWETGRSGNSAFGGGSFVNIWSNPNYWKPNPERFPNGLAPLVRRGQELGIEVCLWFNPSRDNSNADWEKDANALLELYRTYGIRTFKIDGVNLPDKLAEVNFRKLLDKVSRETDYNAVFNLDVTAQRRGGYHYLNTYGNTFLENRYTDWTNYYPYTTLRNLWMLSRYLPAQNLQIEFLNKWRNQDKYPSDDIFAPRNYSFDYLFAITMFAQPLAWFEGTGLPSEAFATSALIKTYRQHSSRIHAGNIFPIGNEPDGRQWTGFQSIADEKTGYVLVFREDNPAPRMAVPLLIPPGKQVTFTRVAGSGKTFRAGVSARKSVPFELPQKNSFGLYQYTVTP